MKETYIYYKGIINHELILAFAKQAEIELVRNQESKLVINRTFHLIVESLERVYNDSEFEILEASKIVSFKFYKQGSAYKVQTENIVNNKKTLSIKHVIDKVNELSDSDLKTLHKKRIKTRELNSCEFSIISLKKKRSKDLSYKIQAYDSNYSRFRFCANVSAC